MREYLKTTMIDTSHRDNKLSWNDVKSIVSFKTFYLVIILALIGTVFILLEIILNPYLADTSWKGVLAAFGITFLTSSTVSLLFEIYLRLDIVDFISERVIKSLPIEQNSNSGFIRFDRDRTALNFTSIWKESSDFLRIIGFSANDILSPSNTPLLLRKLTDNPSFFLKVLIINPWSIMASRRAEASAYKTPNEFIRRVWSIFLETLDTSKQLNAEGIHRSRYEVRIYDDIPTLSMIIDKNTAVVTPIISTSLGGASPYYVVNDTRTSDCAYREYVKHFEYIWSSAEDINGINIKELYDITLIRETVRTEEMPKNLDDWLTTKLGG